MSSVSVQIGFEELSFILGVSGLSVIQCMTHVLCTFYVNDVKINYHCFYLCEKKARFGYYHYVFIIRQSLSPQIDS